MLLKVTDEKENIIKYYDKPEDYRPIGNIHKVQNLKGNKRALHYSDEIHVLENVDQEKGVYAGNICVICSIGVIQDLGGCATCTNCGAQLKCGL